ncbi:lysozyme inhibitor LprI family protein [Sphingobium sp. HWE2-09]|uniref:lysozyme inhibitor LprI family protein n=1 Tax=Sphingobium sp. HWE2-09 TaxID=3108390 RepID=UPI002DD28441|nr:lysozyme inhibitor LprI family protein [Sphingobium sp. HWE2-09]
MRKFGIAVAIAFLLPASAYAANCDAPRNGFDNVYCFAKVYMDLDRQLNDNYVALMKLLNPAQKQVLRDGQRGWIAQRDQQCYRSEGNSNAVNIDCALSTTRGRIQFLSDRLAECRGTGCNLTKLGRVGES